jgi:hypothetical protein
MTCEHTPTHLMAPTTRCRKCWAIIRRAQCPMCGGSRERENEECAECRGTGKGAWVLVKTPDTASPKPTAPPSPDCKGAHSAGGRI